MIKSLALLALANIAAARKCIDITIPISISARNAVFDLKAPTTEIEVTDFFLQSSRKGFNFTQSLLKEYKNVHGNYEIAATYCEPDHGPGHALQILTHGVGFDRNYWDVPFDGYSYTEQAVDQQGYSTFTWDRLGVGHSSKGDPVNEIQIYLEIAALKELTTQLRQGKLCDVNHKYDKVVHLGHSFGSIITYNLVNGNPDLSNGIVLTGFTQNGNFLDQFLLGGNFAPVKELHISPSDYPAGYLAPFSSIGVHINFFSPGDFEPKLLDYATKVGQPASAGELLTVGSGSGTPNGFKGPVYIITGEFDVPFCGGNCKDTTTIQNSYPDLVAFSKQFFPKASVFNSTVVPGAGHGLTLGISSKFANAHINEFIASHI